MTWWKEQLLPNLKQPSIIIMDNASYHCAYPSDVPRGNKPRRADWISYLQSRNIPFDNMDTVPILRDKARKYISEKEKMLVELLAEEQGHKVLFQPPCHSDFQPIELLWAKLKGNIGRKYDSNTTMTVLKQRLDQEFQAAMGWNESIEGFIRSSSNICRWFGMENKKQNDAEEPDDDNNNTSSESEAVEEESDDDSLLVAL